ncbi:hypothetical protein [Zhongshania aliphaticivorans]|uniref:hypothetical protein n=1 Tax=Zhongshania aliphaticivorans TaxID=1470434 RepID=UPI0012E68DB1|nr:hypothetical protein [Zhongshania aliphaticivorans]CAA0081255.1 Uncharacterised protein [Zhongshania aliphaticivorans]
MQIIKLYSSLKPAFQFGSALTVISAIITDVLAPISMLGIWVAVSFFITGILLVIKAFIYPSLWRDSSHFFAELLNFPLAICFFLATAITAYQFGTYQNPEFQNGYLSNKIALIDALQEQLGISEKILKVQQDQLEVQRQGVVKLGEIKGVNEQQLFSQREGVTQLVEIKDAVSNLDLSLYNLSEAAKIGDVKYLEQWDASGHSLNNIHKKLMPVTPSILMDAIQNNMDQITPILAFLEQKGALKADTLFDPEAPYVKNLGIIWQNAIMKSSSIEDAAKSSKTYTEFYEYVLSTYGIEVSGVTEQEYSDFKNGKKYSLDLYGNSQGGRVSLLTFAKVVRNDDAIKFLNKYPTNKSEYIIMQGNKIRLDGDYLRLHQM